MKRFGLLMVVVVLAGCTEDLPIRLAPWDLESRTLDDDLLARQQLFDEIVFARPSSCRSADDCVAVPFGACGTEAIVYSTLTTPDAKTLVERVAAYDWYDAYLMSKWGMVCGGPAPTRLTPTCTSGLCGTE